MAQKPKGKRIARRDAAVSLRDSSVPSSARNRMTGRGGSPQPDGELRRSQLITTFGPGALVDLVHDAVLISSLDYWKNSDGWQTIEEPRLRDRLAAQLLKQGRPLRLEGAFRLPPDGDKEHAHPGRGIQAKEFPEWFVCQGCRALVRATSLERKRERYVHDCQGAVECVPVRFVSACTRGHLDEFSWVFFAHRGKGCESPLLKLHEGPSGDFGSVKIQCESCGAAPRPLVDAKIPENQYACRGRRPWLGPEGDEECPLTASLMVRTASNSYFSQVESALSIPETGVNLYDELQAQWEIFAHATAATLPAFRVIEKVQAAIGTFSDAQVLAAVAALKEGRRPERPPLRTSEYLEFLKQPIEKTGDLPQHDDIFFARRAATTPPDGIGAVVLAHKLREVRAQVGFTRLESGSRSLQGEFDIGVRTASLALTADWLPAVEVLGEGIFVQLDEARVVEWEQRPEVKARADELMTAYDKHAAKRLKTLKDADDEKKEPPFPGMRFYLLHSLSHLMLTTLALDCGYSASAIRERIYCSHPLADEVPMAAFLLSTGTPGSEGTLGGLVEQGRYVEQHLRRALELAALCSNDPVCATHDPVQDPSDRKLDGAACHGCLYVAECSCEWFNRYLDRALVVPIIDKPAALAFFDLYTRHRSWVDRFVIAGSPHRPNTTSIP